MGKLQDQIQDLINDNYARGLDGEKIAERLIEAGLDMMIEEEGYDPGEAIKAHNGELDFRAVIGKHGLLNWAFGPKEAKSAEPGDYIASPISTVAALLRDKAESCRKEAESTPGSEEAFGHAARILENLAHDIGAGVYETDSHSDYLRFFYADVFRRNVKAGWWSDPETGENKKRNVGEMFMLMVTELWEAYEAYVNGANDDHLPQHPGLGVELGDLQIRLADFCGALNAGMVVADTGRLNPGAHLFARVGELAVEYEQIRKTPDAIGEPEKGLYLGRQDVAKMIDDKLAFNAQRADHKPENRIKEGGKRT
jgi:hypothetical protein